MANRKDRKSKPATGDTARKIWLAGIGAYGRAFSEAQGSLAKVTKGSGKMFDDLVQKGEVIETMVTVKSKDVADDVKDMAHDVMDKVGGGLDMDDRIARMRSRLRRSDGSDMHDMETRLDAMEAKLDEILKLLKPKKPVAKKPTPKKRAPRKAATAKTAKKKPASKAKK
ncbi:MAG: hypothetical protein COA69_07820 [Robiginitomaculum sp.]|nr:MAG: hypothetical protein COA69_07820 [Robiginitomaculum sp.]